MGSINLPEILLSLSIGLGLSAACGFRVFTPLLVLSVASLTGSVGLAPGFEWVASWPALIALATATVLEIAAYYIPWLDNLLDTVASPAAVMAGVLATAATFGDVSPMMRWSLALIAGGGLAALVQVGTVGLRGASTATTGGIGNFVVSTGELILSLFFSLLAILWPIVAAALAIVVCLMLVRLAARLFWQRRVKLSSS
ncbi:MAG: DUF4126 domain-containing protein [Caldilineaceae bacterium]